MSDKNIIENIDKYLEEVYDKNPSDFENVSLVNLYDEKALYNIYEIFLNGINKALDDALATNGTSISIFKEYIFNLNSFAYTNPNEILVSISNALVRNKECKNETYLPLAGLTKIIMDKEEKIIFSCINDGFVKKCNWLLISYLLKSLLAEIAKEYIDNPEKDIKDKINNFLFDTILTSNNKNEEFLIG